MISASMDNVTQIGSSFCPSLSILDCENISNVDCVVRIIDSFFMSGICENISILFVHYIVILLCIGTVPAYIVKQILKGLYEFGKRMGGIISKRKSSISRKKRKSHYLPFRKPTLVITSSSPPLGRADESESIDKNRSSLKKGSPSQSRQNRNNKNKLENNLGEKDGFSSEYQAEILEIPKEAYDPEESKNHEDNLGIETSAETISPDAKNESNPPPTLFHLQESENYRVANRDFQNEIKNFHFRTKTLILHRESGNEKITELITVPVPKPRLSLLRKSRKKNGDRNEDVNVIRSSRPVPRPRTQKSLQLRNSMDIDKIAECIVGENDEKIDGNASGDIRRVNELDNDSFCVIPDQTHRNQKRMHTYL